MGSRETFLDEKYYSMLYTNVNNQVEPYRLIIKREGENC